MKRILIAALVLSAGFTNQVQAQVKKPATPVKKPVAAAKPVAKTPIKPIVKAPMFKNNLDSASYALGLNIASSFKAGGLNTINYDLLNKGIKDVFASANPTLTEAQCQQAIQTLFDSFAKEREVMAKQNEELEKQKHMPIINEGAKFLAENKTKAGVKTTPSGLQYEVITLGNGEKPNASNRVTVHYKGTLLDGTQFDSSYDRGEPITLGLSQVIAGWTEGVQLMPVGSKYKFFIPYELAYGGRTTGSIPAFSTLIFEVELIKIEE